MSKVKVAFASKNFQSNEMIEFKIYDQYENLIYESFGNEWSDSGVYYIEVNLYFPWFFHRTYLVIAKEVFGIWKSAKLISKKNVV